MGEFVKNKKKELQDSKKQAMNLLIDDFKRPVKERIKAMNEHMDDHFQKSNGIIDEIVDTFKKKTENHSAMM